MNIYYIIVYNKISYDVPILCNSIVRARILIIGKSMKMKSVNNKCFIKPMTLNLSILPT